MSELKPLFESKQSNKFLLIKFNNTLKLFDKTDVHVQAYESWQNSDEIEIEELTNGQVAERLAGESKYNVADWEDTVEKFLKGIEEYKRNYGGFPNREFG